MGTIADLLGYQIDVPGDNAATIIDEAASAIADDAQLSAAERAREAAMEAVLTETGLDPSAARAELRLVEDLDLDQLALYAIVSAVEHETKKTLKDTDIASWITLGDLLEGVS